MRSSATPRRSALLLLLCVILSNCKSPPEAFVGPGPWKCRRLRSARGIDCSWRWHLYRKPGEGLDELEDEGADEDAKFVTIDEDVIANYEFEEGGFFVTVTDEQRKTLGNTMDLLAALQKMEEKAKTEMPDEDNMSGQEGDAAFDMEIYRAVNTVSTYARRYKMPQKARQERQAAKREAMEDSYWSWFEGIEEPDCPEIFPPAHAPNEDTAGWDNEEIDEYGLVREGLPSSFWNSDLFSEAAERARARWSDPEYKSRMLKKRKRNSRSVAKEQAKSKELIESMPLKIEELDHVNVTEDEALGALTNHKVAEDKRRELIRLRFEDPNKWMDVRLSNGTQAWAPATEEKMIELQQKRKEKAVKAYKKRATRPSSVRRHRDIPIIGLIGNSSGTATPPPPPPRNGDDDEDGGDAEQ